MQLEPTSRAWLGRWMVAGWILLMAGGCGDDFVGGTETASGTGTGTSAESSTTVDTPTTTNPPTTTEGGMTEGTVSASTTDSSSTPTTAPTTEDTTQGIDTDTTTGSTGDTSTGSTSDTDTSTTDTTTGDDARNRSVTQTVNAGHLVTSPNFRLVFTMGQPTQNQGTTDSPNFKLRGGLVGANGSPP
jgi:hypothetical protein